MTPLLAFARHLITCAANKGLILWRPGDEVTCSCGLAAAVKAYEAAMAELTEMKTCPMILCPFEKEAHDLREQLALANKVLHASLLPAAAEALAREAVSTYFRGSTPQPLQDLVIAGFDQLLHAAFFPQGERPNEMVSPDDGRGEKFATQGVAHSAPAPLPSEAEASGHLTAKCPTCDQPLPASVRVGLRGTETPTPEPACHLCGHVREDHVPTCGYRDCRCAGYVTAPTPTVPSDIPDGPRVRCGAKHPTKQFGSCGRWRGHSGDHREMNSDSPWTDQVAPPSHAPAPVASDPVSPPLMATDITQAQANELQDILRTLTSSGTALISSARSLVNLWEVAKLKMAEAPPALTDEMVTEMLAIADDAIGVYVKSVSRITDKGVKAAELAAVRTYLRQKGVLR